MLKILRTPSVLAKCGLGRSAFYAAVQRGLMPRPVRISDRASGVPEHEVEAVMRARLAGHTDEQVRMLVDRLHAERVAAVEAA